MRKLILLLAMLLAVNAGCITTQSINSDKAATVVIASSDPDSKIMYDRFRTSTTITIPTSATFGHLTSILMSFESAPQTIEWKINLIRDGKTYYLVNYTSTGRTFVWYAPNFIHLQSGDQIYIETGVSVWARVYLSVQF